MSKGIAPKVKRTTLTKDAKINKSKQQNVNTLKKDLKHQERHQTWNKRLQDFAKEKEQKQKLTKAQPLTYFDNLNEQLDKIEIETKTKTVVPPRPDTLNPHLRRVVSNRGRKQTLKKEQDQFLKVMSHPAFMSNPIGAIGKHLTNTINQINNIPKPRSI